MSKALRLVNLKEMSPGLAMTKAEVAWWRCSMRWRRARLKADFVTMEAGAAKDAILEAIARIPAR